MLSAAYKRLKKGVRSLRAFSTVVDRNEECYLKGADEGKRINVEDISNV